MQLGRKGELYAVAPQCLAELDELEEHPNWYRREPAEIAMDDGGRVTAWLYFFPQPRGELIPSGDYADFLAPGQNGKS
jgi:gamma-glutamylaminecyclotransferase